MCVCNPIWDCVGVSYGPHATFGCIATMEFVKGWRPNEAAIEARAASGPVKVAGQEEAKKNVSTQWKLGACMVCHEEIRGGSVMELEQLGGKVHKDCFNCKECGKSLCGVPWSPHERTCFCKPCYTEKHGEKCTGCGKGLDGSMMKCALGKFHVDCVVCGTCKKPIGKGPFSTAGGALACQACSSQKKAPGPTSAAGSAILAREPRLPAAGGSRPNSRPGSPGTPSPAKAKAGAAVGAPKAGAAPKAKAKTKASLAGAGAAVVGLGMDYAALG